ncbi:MAG: hypothetical protein KKE39_10245 [Bacteroidetes bacterium]|nr:hypothetical protein [Bacteroidota bacterium]MBU1371106.1 hypothetical protein [Bacteroidota bacterium]MBU1486012.1 hypothetical protein [Bacteroidota bacterium]MBU1759391.1 hypothetical protein [Bacteroidota bacterium]MBU2267613.1 hypothetical protein [Bacteroidota bacterium]
MTKTKFLTIGVVILLILNFGTLTFLFTKKPPHPLKFEQEGPKKIIIERLGFDKQQIEKYELLIKNHQQAIEKLQKEIKESKNELYATLVTSDTSNVELLEKEISYLQLEIEKTHYQHFQDIKILCKPNQLIKFNDLALDLAKLFKPRKE